MEDLPEPVDDETRFPDALVDAGDLLGVGLVIADFQAVDHRHRDVDPHALKLSEMAGCHGGLRVDRVSPGSRPMVSSTAIASRKIDAAAEARRLQVAGLVESVVAELQDRQRLGAQHLAQGRLDRQDAGVVVVVGRHGERPVA